ncbi:hypothetical protein Ddc_22642 [Ditylenchus destructor]|nr:hypothetical protein Ddc_22642 [Ditylenchus destructor]
MKACPTGSSVILVLRMAALIFVATGFGSGKCLQQLGCHKGRYDRRPLVPDARAADGQRELCKAGRRLSLPPQPMGEGGAFGLRADHADIGEVVADKRLLRDEEIECVIVGDDDGRPVCRDFLNERFRHGREDGCDACRNVAQLAFTCFHHRQGQR